MNLAAVLVHYGNPDYTGASLSRLEKSQNVQKIIAVLHDAFPHEKHFKRVEFIKSQNKGYAAGVNRAAQKIDLEYKEITHLLVMNADVNLSSGQIRDLMAEHLRSRADCTFPALMEDTREVHGYNVNSLGLLRPARDKGALFPGTCFVISMNAWRKTGGMSEKYFHYFEDMDFCLRLEKARLKSHHASNVVIRHVGKSGVDYPDSELPKYAVRNHLYFLSQVGRLNVLSYLSVIVAHLLYLLRWKHGWKGIKAWMKGIQEYKSL
jgi:GT2 family glycosyltransferase